jgi:hypothetical protein
MRQVNKYVYMGSLLTLHRKIPSVRRCVPRWGGLRAPRLVTCMMNSTSGWHNLWYQPNWWITNQKLYPRLSHMAIDVHATPSKLIYILYLSECLFVISNSYCCGCRAVLQPQTDSHQSSTQSALSIFHSSIDVLWRLVLSPTGVGCRSCFCFTF